MNLLRYAHPQFLLALWFIPVFIALFVLALIHRKRAIEKYGDITLISMLMPDVSVIRLILKFLLIILSYASIIIALARPQFGSKLEKVKRNGVEVMVALDISNSMKCEDIEPSRLDKAKMAIARLIEEMSNDKIGIIVFAGDAYTQLPMTADYGAAKLFLNTVKPSFIHEQGTAIGKALDLGLQSFTDNKDVGKAIIVISDGENHEDDAVEKAKECASKGIIVHTIGMGTIDGKPIPITPGSNDFQKDRDGNVVITRINEQMLQEIAASGGGMYIRASSSNAGLDVLFKQINKMNKSDIESTVYTDYDEKYQYFIGLSLIFLILELIIIERKNKVLKRIKIFDISIKSKK